MKTEPAWESTIFVVAPHSPPHPPGPNTNQWLPILHLHILNMQHLLVGDKTNNTNKTSQGMQVFKRNVFMLHKNKGGVEKSIPDYETTRYELGGTRTKNCGAEVKIRGAGQKKREKFHDSCRKIVWWSTDTFFSANLSTGSGIHS